MTVANKSLALGDQVASFSSKARTLLKALSNGTIDPATVTANIEEATRLAIADVMEQLEALEVTELSRYVDDQRRFSDVRNEIDHEVKFAVEFFNSLYTFSDVLTVEGVKTVSGDDSVDVESTAKLSVGEDYVLQSSGVQEIITLKEIVSSTRFKAVEPLDNSMSGGTLTKTNWTIVDNQAVANTGQVYFSKPVNVDPVTLAGGRARSIVVRQSTAADPVTVYFRDSNHAEWTEAPWKWKRNTGTGFVTQQWADQSKIDYEYMALATGDFELKIVANSDSTVIDFIAAITADTNLRGDHHPPEVPTILAPMDGQTDVGEQLPMTIADDDHPVPGARVTEVRFQMSDTGGDFSAPIYDTGFVDGIGATMERGIMSTSTTYYLRAQVRDNEGAESEWTSEVSFTTAAEFTEVNTPAPISPDANSELLFPDGLTLVSSEFSVTGPEDTHAASRWEIATDPAFETIVYTSGETVTDLTSHVVPDETLSRGGTYYWRVSHQGTNGGWSCPSSAVVFEVRASYPFVSIYGGDSYHSFYSAAADSEGNVVVAGNASLSNDDQMLLFKFANDGTVLWAKSLGGGYSDTSGEVYVDDSDNIYLSGYEASSQAANTNAYLAKFDSNGSMQWQKRYSGASTDRFADIAIDTANGFIYAAGNEHSSNGTSEALICKLSIADGSIVWQKRLGGAHAEQFYGVDIDSTGAPYAVGFENTSVSGGNMRALVAKFGTDGTLAWQNHFETSGVSVLHSVAIDDSDGVYLAGFGTDDAGDNSGLLVKLTTAGAVSWKKYLGGSGEDRFYSVAVDANGNVLVSGNQSSDITGSAELGLLAKIDTSGTLLWQRSLGDDDAEADTFYGVTVSPDETVYAVGLMGDTGGYSYAVLASLLPDATGASGQIPYITTMEFTTPSLVLADSGMTVAASSLTLADSALSVTSASLILEDIAGTVTVSGY